MLGRARHDGGEIRHVAVREGRRGRAALPAPVLALGDEKAFADGRTQQVLGRLRLGIGVEPLKQHAPDRAGVHHHVPAQAGLAGDHRLRGGDGRDDRQDIAPGGLKAGQQAQRLRDQRHPDGQRLGGVGVGVRCMNRHVVLPLSI